MRRVCTAEHPLAVCLDSLEVDEVVASQVELGWTNPDECFHALPLLVQLLALLVP